MGNTFGAVLVVLGLLAAALFVLRRLNRSTMCRRRIEVLETVPVAQGQSVALVRAGSRCFIVGATSGQVCLISELDWADVATPPARSGRPRPWVLRRAAES